MLFVVKIVGCFIFECVALLLKIGRLCTVVNKTVVKVEFYNCNVFHYMVQKTRHSCDES